MATVADDDSGLGVVDLGSPGAACGRAPLDEAVGLHEAVGDQQLKLQL